MLNKNLLRAAMAARGFTQEKLAESIGISSNTLSSRMVGASCFNTEEIDKICDVLGIDSNDQKANIFLALPSQIWEMQSATPNIEKGELAEP